MESTSQTRGNSESNAPTFSEPHRQLALGSASISAAARALSPTLRRFGPALLVAAAYYAGARIGFALTPSDQTMSLLWPPNAILFAALLLMPPRRWPGILLAVFPAHLCAEISVGVPLAPALAGYVDDTSEALLGAACLRLVTNKPLCASLWGVIAFLVFGVFLAPFVTSFLDAALVVLTGWGVDFWQLWKTRLFANMLANLVIVPPIFLSVTGMSAWIKEAKRRDWIELGVLTTATVLVATLVLNANSPSWSNVPILVYSLLPLLLWAAVRFGCGAVSGSLLAVAILALWSAMHSRGLFSFGSVTENVFALQVFLGVVGAPLLALAAVLQERRAALENLRLDIVEREKAQRQLIESQKRYEMATGTTGVVVWEWNLQTNRVYFDPVLPDIPGYSQEGSQTYDEWLEWIHPEERSRVEATLRALSNGKSSFDLEYRVLSKDGMAKWLQHKGTFREEEPGTGHVLGTLTDLTERKLALLALAESEQRFRQTADAAPMLVWMCDENNLGNYFNRAWLEFTGRKLEEELGCGWIEGVHPDDVKELLATCGPALESREQFRTEYRLRRHDGEYRWVLEHGAPRFDANSIFLGFIGSAIDITDRKRAEVTSMQLSGKLMQAQEGERQRIARELHDDVGQRLAVLSVEIDKLREKLSSKLRSRASRIWNQASSIANSVHDISHDLHSPGLDLLGLSTALNALLDEFSDQHSVQVSFSEHDVPTNVPDDIKLTFYRVTQEALQNVAKHSCARSVSLQLNGTSEKLTLCITDDGIGFDPEQQTLAGLGIASMRERVRSIGGVMTITSAQKHGTKLEVAAPLHPVTAGKQHGDP